MLTQNRVTFNAADGIFEITNPAASMCKISVRYPFSSSSFSADDVEVSLFSNALHAESQVFRTRLSDTSDPGWLFAASAATSHDHEYCEDVHFRRAAFASTSYILKFLLSIKFIEKNDGKLLDLGEIAKENLSILVHTKLTIADAHLPTTDAIYPFMLSIGFVPVQLDSDLVWEPSEFAEQRFRAINKNVSIKFRSNPLSHAVFVRELFGRRIQEAKDPILKFYFFYQLIELLSEEILQHNTNEIVEELYRSRTVLAKVHALMEKMREQRKGKTRLNKLMNDFTKGTGDAMTVLLRLCNEAILSSSLEAEKTVGHALYSVRNLVVHNLRGAPSSFTEQLKTINGYLEVGIPDLLNAFEIPAPS